MTTTKNIYLLMDNNGRIAAEDLRLIQQHIDNDFARTNIGKALKYGFEALTSAHIHIVEYANLELYCVKASNTSARNVRLKCEFINQETHDKDGMQKLTHLTQ